MLQQNNSLSFFNYSMEVKSYKNIGYGYGFSFRPDIDRNLISPQNVTSPLRSNLKKRPRCWNARQI